MDPMTMMLLMGATALSSISKIGGGYMNSDLAKLQQSVASGNAALLAQSANLQAKEGQLAFDQGALDQSRTIAAVNRTLGAETGKFAASNLDPTAGSPLLLEGYSAGQGATDVAILGAKAELGNANALMNSASTMAQRAGAVGQAAGFGMQATQDVLAGWLGAGTAALQGGANAAQWSNLNTATSSVASGGGSGTFISDMAVY